MKSVLLIGAGHAHAVVLRSLAKTPLYGARITLVTPEPTQLYSGMVPGVIAGHYRRAEAEIDFTRLAQLAYADLVASAVRRIDAEQRLAILADGSELGYDFVSLDVGSLIDTSIPGSREHALPARPFENFLDRLGDARLIALAGGGAAGAELAMALAYRGAAVTLYSDKPAFAPTVEQRIAAALRRARVDYRRGMPVDAVEAGPVVRSGASRQEFDLVVLTTGAAAPAWSAESGLETDAEGFVRVHDTLQSVSHPEVFAVGDCASLRPKSGVYAVRQGAALFENLVAAVKAQAPKDYRAPRRALSLISCGSRSAVATWGEWSARGRWVWYLKDWIDRRWIAKFR